MREKTKQRCQYIRANIHKTDAELAEDLEVTKNTIRHCIRILGLQGIRQKGPRKCLQFDEYITEHFPFESAGVIAQQINKSYTFVLSVAKRLSLKHNQNFDIKPYPPFPMRENLIGQRFGRLVVVKQLGTNKYGQRRYECQCDCGNITTALAGNLKGGYKKSCGCLRRELGGELNKKRYKKDI